VSDKDGWGYGCAKSAFYNVLLFILGKGVCRSIDRWMDDGWMVPKLLICGDVSDRAVVRTGRSAPPGQGGRRDAQRGRLGIYVLKEHGYV
jgi:hypothetical protein